MFNANMKSLLAAMCIVLAGLGYYLYSNNQQKLPIVAIASYGPHSSLINTIKGIKAELELQGMVEGKDVKYSVVDVGFDPLLINQMIADIKASKPAVVIALTTPIAQVAVNIIKETPLILGVITDPKQAGFSELAQSNLAGIVSDKQDLLLLLEFAKKILPQAKKIGLLYSTSEVNDAALLRMMQEAASAADMEVVSIAIDQARDIPMRIEALKGAVDFIYVGASGPIQPALPAISAFASRVGIPVFNLDEEAVAQGQVLGSFGVSYDKIGRAIGKLACNALRMTKGEMAEIYPSQADHQAFISSSKLQALALEMPADLNATTVE